MKLLLSILLIALLAGIAEWFAPWWSLAAAAAMVAFLLKLRPGKAFLAGFLGIGLLWLGFVLWRDIPNGHILSERLAKLFKLPNHTLFIVVTAVLGGLLGGLSAWAGAQLVIGAGRRKNT
jgi:hypothetical protein